MKTVSKGKLKAQMLAYFREVEATGEPLIVTDYGREVLEVRPVARSFPNGGEFLRAYHSGPVQDESVVIPGERELLSSESISDWETLNQISNQEW